VPTGEAVVGDETIADIAVAVSESLQGDVFVQSPINNKGGDEIVIGDDYFADDGRSLIFGRSGLPDLTGATVTYIVGERVNQNAITLTPVFSVEGDVIGGNRMQFELSSDETDLLDPRKTYFREVQAVLASGHEITPFRARLQAVSKMSPVE
jgi:hypothetical protein